jgi:hypothetical protein
VLKFQTVPEWRKWRSRREGLLRGRFKSPFYPAALGLYSDDPWVSDTSHLVVSLENLSPTQVASLLRPEAVLRSRNVPVAVIAPLSIGDGLAHFGLTLRERLSGAGVWSHPKPKMILATSHCSASGRFSWELSRNLGIPFVIVQHGVVTPFAPPLPEGCHLFAWTLEDAEFWISGRTDVTTTVVGSQIIWDAGASRSQASDPRGPICFLGQLHGPELSRLTTIRSVAELARTVPIAYRPHPGETDFVSRLIHRRWQFQGIPIEPPTSRLGENNAAVAGIFSTGILEAAASGRAAFGFCAHPPSWLPEFWARYNIKQFGTDEATQVEIPTREPAAVISETAEVLA